MNATCLRNKLSTRHRPLITDNTLSCPSMKAILYKKCFAPAR